MDILHPSVNFILDYNIGREPVVAPIVIYVAVLVPNCGTCIVLPFILCINGNDGAECGGSTDIEFPWRADALAVVYVHICGGPVGILFVGIR